MTSNNKKEIHRDILFKDERRPSELNENKDDYNFWLYEEPSENNKPKQTGLDQNIDNPVNNLIPNNVENNDNFDNENNPVNRNNFDNMNNFENNENNVGNENNIENVLDHAQVNVNEPRYALRDRRNLQPPNRGDFIFDFENIDELFIADFDEPKDYEQAVNSANSDDWR